MKLRSKFAASALVLGMTAGAAAAQGYQGHQGDGGSAMQCGHGMSQMMTRMHGMMGDRGRMHGMDMMDGMMGMGLHERFDENGDFDVTADEIRSGLDGLRTQYDEDGDGALSIDEFETLHSALIRERMVDRFQHLDNDGDGQVTEEEMQEPVRQMERMHKMHDRMMERSGDAHGEMMDQDGQTRPGLGHPMGGTGAADTDLQED